MSDQPLTWANRVGWAVASIGACFVVIDLVVIGLEASGGEAALAFRGHFTLATLLHLFFGVYAFITGIAFANRQTWARGALEAGCWVWLIYSICFDVWVALFLRGLVTRSPGTSSWGILLTVAVSTALAWVLALVAIVAFLRSARVRKAFSKDAVQVQGAA